MQSRRRALSFRPLDSRPKKLPEVDSAAKGVFPCSYELWAYGDQQCPCDPDLHAVAASSLFPAALSEPGSCRMGPHGAAGRVLERRSLPPGEMFSPLYGTGCTTLCAMSAPVQEKQTALSQLPARLLPPAVRASPAPCVPKSICWRRRHMSLLAHTALQQGQVDWAQRPAELPSR